MICKKDEKKVREIELLKRRDMAIKKEDIQNGSLYIMKNNIKLYFIL